MATVTTTELSPEISATLDRLEALYNEFDESDNVYFVFDKIVAEFKLSKLPEPYLSSEIENVKTAMAGHIPPGEVDRRLSGRASKRHPGDIEATMLYDIASSQLELYQDKTSLYARFEAEDGHYELYPLASTPIRAYLRKLAKKELDKVVRRDVINAVLE